MITINISHNDGKGYDRYYNFNNVSYSITVAALSYFKYIFDRLEDNNVTVKLTYIRKDGFLPMYIASVVNGCYVCEISKEYPNVYFCCNEFDRITGLSPNIGDTIWYNFE